MKSICCPLMNQTKQKNVKDFEVFLILEFSVFAVELNCRLLSKIPMLPHVLLLWTIVAKGVKISTDQFFPQKIQHQKSTVFCLFSRVFACFSRAFPKNQHRPEKIAPTGWHGWHVFATLCNCNCNQIHLLYSNQRTVMHLCNNGTVYKLGSKVSGQLGPPTCIQNHSFLRVMTEESLR